MDLKKLAKYTVAICTLYLTVPGAPKLTNILPYYNSTSRELKKIDVEIMNTSSVC